MITHCALFRFHDDADDDAIAAFEQGLAGLPALIPEIRSYAYGRDLAIDDDNADYAVIATFDDEAGYRVYADHPDHVEVKRSLARPIIASRLAVQFGQ